MPHNIKLLVLRQMLTIHLKRFKHTNKGGIRKINKHIGFDETLCVDPYRLTR